MFLSIVVPAYNEAAKLGQSIKKFKGYLDSRDFTYEIIVVNDGSTDETADIAARLEKKFPELKLINNRRNRGKGYAVKQGLLASRGEFSLFLDADNSTTIDHLEKCWLPLEQGHEIVIGSRNPLDAEGARILLSQNTAKKTLGKLGNRLFRLLLVPGIRDTQCGFKVFSRRAVKTVIPRLTINRFAFDAEMLVIAKIHGCPIAKIPVTWRNDFQSSVKTKDYFTTLRDAFRIAINARTGKYDKTRPDKPGLGK